MERGVRHAAQETGRRRRSAGAGGTRAGGRGGWDRRGDDRYSGGAKDPEDTWKWDGDELDDGGGWYDDDAATVTDEYGDDGEEAFYAPQSSK